MRDSAGAALLVDDGAIVVPEDSPSAIQMAATLVEWMFSGEFLIHFDPPSGLVAGVEIAVLISCAALEDFSFKALDDAALLDAETTAGQVQMKLRRVAHRRDIGRAVPRCLDPKIFSQDRDLAGRRRASGRDTWQRM